MPDPTPAEIDAGARALYDHEWRSPDQPTWDERDAADLLSYCEAIAAVLRAVLPGHDARLRAAVAEDIARALLAHDQRYPRDWIGGSDGATRAAAIARAHTTGGDPT